MLNDNGKVSRFISSKESDDRDESKAYHAVLVIKKFAQAPYMNFGNVPIGTAATETIVVTNNEKTSIDLVIESIPTKAGIRIKDFNVRDRFTVPGEGAVSLYAEWTPMQFGKIHEAILFKFNQRHLLKVNILGEGVEGRHKRTKRTGVEPTTSEPLSSTATVAPIGRIQKRKVPLEVPSRYAKLPKVESAAPTLDLESIKKRAAADAENVTASLGPSRAAPRTDALAVPRGHRNFDAFFSSLKGEKRGLVDENKLSGKALTTLKPLKGLRPEKERFLRKQEGLLTIWLNFLLERHHMEFHFVSLLEEIRDSLAFSRITILLKTYYPIRSAKGKPELREPCNTREAQCENFEKLFMWLRPIRYPIRPEDFLDGKLEKIIDYLWRLLTDMVLPKVVDKDKIKSEVSELDSQTDDITKAEAGLDGFSTDETQALVQKWCKLNACRRGYECKNFHSTDWGMICAIINRYDDDLIKMKDIRASRNETDEPHTPEDNTRAWTVSLGRNEDQALANQTNHQLVNNALTKLAGMPQVSACFGDDLLNENNIDDIWSEREAKFFFYYLCSALIGHKVVKATAGILKEILRKNDLKRRLQFATDCPLNEVRKMVTFARAAGQMYTAQHSFLEGKESIICLQAEIRQSLFERKYNASLCAASKLTALVKSKQEEEKYNAQVRAICAFERLCRRNSASLDIARLIVARQKREEARKKFLDDNTAIKALQACIRSSLQRGKYLEEMLFVTTVQGAVRSKLHQQCITEVTRAAECISQLIRAASSTEKQNAEFLGIKNAATSLQGVTRATSSTEGYKSAQTMAIVIQAHLRCANTLSDYKSQVGASHNIGNIMKAHRKMDTFSAGFTDARTNLQKLQGILRATIRNKEYATMCHSSASIQATLRSKFLIDHMTSQRDASQNISKLVRALQAKSSVERKFSKCKEISQVLQGTVRSVLRSVEYSGMLSQTKDVQAALRKKLWEHAFANECNSASTISGLVRAIQVRDNKVKEFYDIKTGACLIQGCIRTAFNSFSYNTALEDIRTLQACVRTELQHKEYTSMANAANTMKTFIRAKIFANEQESRFNKKQDAANESQSVCRAAIQQKEYNRIQRAAHTLQAVSRSSTTKQGYDTSKAIARDLETFIRAHQTLSEMKGQTIIAMGFQAMIRQHATRPFDGILAAVVDCQSLIRRKQMQNEYSTHIAAARVAQAGARELIEQTSYADALDAQRCSASCIRAAAHTRAYEKLRCAAICAEAHIHSKLGLSHMESQRDAARSLAALIRCTHGSAVYDHKRSAVENLQALIRAKEAHEYHLRLCKTTVKCQAVCRAICARQRVMQMRFLYNAKVEAQKRAAINLQRMIRMKEVRAAYVQGLAEQKAVLLQTFVRANLAQVKYQQLQHAVLRMQAIHRGNVARREVERRFGTVAERRARQQQRAKEARQQQRLADIAVGALNQILTYRQLAQVGHACEQLEWALFCSRKVRVDVITRGCLTRILEIISQLNRSAPHLKILKDCFQMLVTIVKDATSFERLTDDQIRGIFEVVSDQLYKSVKNPVLLGLCAEIIYDIIEQPHGDKFKGAKRLTRDARIALLVQNENGLKKIKSVHNSLTETKEHLKAIGGVPKAKQLQQQPQQQSQQEIIERKQELLEHVYTTLFSDAAPVQKAATTAKPAWR